MDLTFTPEERAFQQEVRAFLKEKLTPDLRRAHHLTPSVFSDPPVGNRWQKILYERGWAAPLWPKEYGGTGWSLAQRYIWEIESAAAGAPSVTPMGLRMVGPVIMGQVFLIFGHSWATVGWIGAGVLLLAILFPADSASQPTGSTKPQVASP